MDYCCVPVAIKVPAIDRAGRDRIHAQEPSDARIVIALLHIRQPRRRVHDVAGAADAVDRLIARAVAAVAIRAFACRDAARLIALRDRPTQGFGVLVRRDDLDHPAMVSGGESTSIRWRLRDGPSFVNQRSLKNYCPCNLGVLDRKLRKAYHWRRCRRVLGASHFNLKHEPPFIW